MQAGVVSRPLTWRDIFTARDLSPRLIAVVRLSVAIEPWESEAAQAPTLSWAHERRAAA